MATRENENENAEKRTSLLLEGFDFVFFAPFTLTFHYYCKKNKIP